jgi:hypothetical protein
MWDLFDISQLRYLLQIELLNLYMQFKFSKDD